MPETTFHGHGISEHGSGEQPVLLDLSRRQAVRIFDSMILNSARIYVQRTDTKEPQRKVQ